MTRNSLLTFIGCIVIYTTISSCTNKTDYVPERIKAELLPISINTPEDKAIENFIKPYKETIESEMDSTLAFTPNSYSKNDSKYNTAIGNMMADAVFEMANPIFKKRAGYSFNAVLLNHGGIRASLNQGDITTRTAYELMPFDNEVVVVELSGKQIHKMFNYLKQGKAHPISGITFRLDSNGEIEKAQIQGQDIRDDETYFIATSDYLKNGGDHMNFFSNSVSELTLDYKIRNVLIDYFKKYDTIAPVIDNRFTKDTK